MSVREVDGIKVAFCRSEDYFASMLTPSMYSTSQETGAEFVFLLRQGVNGSDVSDDEIRALIAAAANPDGGARD